MFPPFCYVFTSPESFCLKVCQSLDFSETKQLRFVRVLRILRGNQRLRFDLKDQLAMFPAWRGVGQRPTGCLDGHPNLPRWGPRKPAINGMSFGGPSVNGRKRLI